MDNQMIETIVLTIVLALCVLFMARKAIAKFSKKGSGCSGCSGCSAKIDEPPADDLGK